MNDPTGPDPNRSITVHVKHPGFGSQNLHFDGIILSTLGDAHRNVHIDGSSRIALTTRER